MRTRDGEIYISPHHHSANDFFKLLLHQEKDNNKITNFTLDGDKFISRDNIVNVSPCLVYNTPPLLSTNPTTTH